MNLRRHRRNRLSVTISTVSDRSLTEQLPTHSDDGVDLTLIRWMLSLTPAERLEVLQSAVNSIIDIREQNAKT
jgi:hypothetical protein